jgi:hypothetical protein
VDHRDRDAASNHPAEQGQTDTDLMPGEGEPMLLSDDRRHAHPYWKRQRIPQDEEGGGNRVHRSSMPENRR